MSYRRSHSLTWIVVLLFSVKQSGSAAVALLPAHSLTNNVFIQCESCGCVSSGCFAVVGYATCSAPKSCYWALTHPCLCSLSLVLYLSVIPHTTWPLEVFSFNFYSLLPFLASFFPYYCSLCIFFYSTSSCKGKAFPFKSFPEISV